MLGETHACIVYISKLHYKQSILWKKSKNNVKFYAIPQHVAVDYRKASVGQALSPSPRHSSTVNLLAYSTGSRPDLHRFTRRHYEPQPPDGQSLGRLRILAPRARGAGPPRPLEEPELYPRVDWVVSRHGSGFAVENTD